MAQGYAGVPAGPLSAYLGVREANRAASLSELQAALQAQSQMAQRELDPLKKQLMEAQVADLQQRPEDRKAQMANTLEMGRGRLQQQANQLEMQNQFNTSRIQGIQDEIARKKAADEWKKTYQQGQLENQRGMLEIKQKLAEMKAIPGNEPLKAPELLHYIDQEGNHPAPGTTLNDVIKKGYKLATTQEVNMLLAGRGAESTVNQLDKYITSIWGKEGEDKISEGIRNRTTAKASFAIDRVKQSNPDLNAYEAFAQGTLAPLIRAIGEKGALAEGDVLRAIELLPKTGSKLNELPDTSVVARQKMQQLRDWFTTALGKQSSTPKITSDAEYNALPSGTTFIAPDGTRRKKP